MRFPTLLTALPLTLAVAGLAAGCGSTQASNTSSNATAATPASAAASGVFPASIKAANGTVKVPSRPTAIVSLSPTGTEMLYAIGAGGQVKAVELTVRLPAAGAAHQAVRLPAERGGDRRGKAGPGDRGR